MKKFDFNIRVYYDSTDAGGVVYHSRYLDFCERCRTELLRDARITQSTLLKEKKVGFVVKDANIKFKKPAKLDDLLKITTEVVENSGVIIKMLQKIYLTSREGLPVEDDLLFEMEISLVCVNGDFRPTRIPKEIMEELS